MTKKNLSLLVIISFATVYIVWGSTYFFILLSLESFPPMLLGAFRFLIAGLIMLIYSMIRGEELFGKRDIVHSSICGFLMLFGGTGVVIWVEQVLPSALVAILVSGAPFWFVLLDKPMWKSSFSSKSIVTGLVIGFIGIILLFSEKIRTLFIETDNRQLESMLLVLLGSLSWVSGSIYSKYNTTEKSNTVNVGWQMFSAGIFFAIVSVFKGELHTFEWSSITMKSWFSIWILILFGSIAAYTAYVWLLSVRPSAQVSTYAYVNPVVAVLLGVFFANETISILQISGLATILISVMMINFAKYRKAKRAQLT
jgi:drug/metabolite transporter (DMT)-like permease